MRRDCLLCDHCIGSMGGERAAHQCMHPGWGLTEGQLLITVGLDEPLNYLPAPEGCPLEPGEDLSRLCPACGKEHRTIVDTEDCEWFQRMEAVVGEHGWLRPVVAVIDNPEGPEELRVFRNPRAAAIQGWADHCASTYRVCDPESITGRDFTEVTELQAVLERAQNTAFHRPSKMRQLEQGCAAMDEAVKDYRQLYQSTRAALSMLDKVEEDHHGLIERTKKLLKLELDHINLQEQKKPTPEAEEGTMTHEEKVAELVTAMNDREQHYVECRGGYPDTYDVVGQHLVGALVNEEGEPALFTMALDEALEKFERAKAMDLDLFEAMVEVSL